MHGPASSANERQSICSTCTSCPRCPQAERGVSDEKLAAEINLACQAIAASYGLSAREREILPYLIRGHKALSIAHALGMSESTVRMHTRRMHSKLGVSSGDGLFRLVEAQGTSATPPQGGNAVQGGMNPPETKRGPVGDRASQGGMRRIFIKG